MLCIQDELSTHFLCCGKQEQHSHYYLIYLWNILLALIFTKLELKLWQQNNLPTTWLKSVLSRNNDNEPKGEKERKKESERERERDRNRDTEIMRGTESQKESETEIMRDRKSNLILKELDAFPRVLGVLGLLLHALHLVVQGPTQNTFEIVICK